jgi:hypothetical protein
MKYWVILICVYVFVIYLLNKDGGEMKKVDSLKPQSTEKPCGVGDENCISKVRDRFTNTGKNILGEKYLGNGKFGITFMDAQKPGAFEATVYTDCDCNVINADVRQF